MRGCACDDRTEGTTLDLDAKLASFDAQAQHAVDLLVRWLGDNGHDLIVLARGRHVAGHYRFQEKGLFEYDADALLAEAAEEIADAIVYLSRRLHLLS